MKIKKTITNGVTQLTAEIGYNSHIVITCESSSSHIKDRYTVQRFVLIPSILRKGKWDQLSGERFCINAPYDNVIARMYEMMNDMEESLSHED